MSAFAELLREVGAFGGAIALVGAVLSMLSLGGLVFALAAPRRGLLVTLGSALAGTVVLFVTGVAYWRDSMMIESALLQAAPDQIEALRQYGQATLHAQVGLGLGFAAAPFGVAAAAAGRRFARGAGLLPVLASGLLLLGVSTAFVAGARHQFAQRALLKMAAMADDSTHLKAALRDEDGASRALGGGALGLGLVVVGATLTQAGARRSAS